MNITATIWNFVTKQISGFRFVVTQESDFNFKIIIPKQGKWILADGFWDNNGIWINSEVWQIP